MVFDARLILSVFATVVLSLPASAQQYPSKTITFISPGTPAGGMDHVLRAYTPELNKLWKQQVIVENRPGAAGLVGALAMARAEPDGYTLMVHAGDVLVYNYFNKGAPEGEKVFLPVTILSNQVQVCIANPATGAKTLKELVAYGKANPNKFNVASFTTSVSQLMIARLVRLLGIEANIVSSYNTQQSQVLAVMSNDTQFACMTPAGVAEQVKAGKLNAVAVTTRQRSTSFPDVPTVREQGYDLVYEQYFAIFAPVGTPQGIVSQLRRDFGTIMKNPDVMALVKRGGYDPETRTPEESVAAIDGELKMYKQLIREAGIKPQ